MTKFRNELRELAQLYQFGGVFELAAGGVDVASAGTADEGRDSALVSTDWKASTRSVSGMEKGISGPGLRAMRLTLARSPRMRSTSSRACVGVVVEAAEQDVFEGEALAVAEREVAQGGEQLLDGPLLRDGHDFGAERFVGRVERDGELGADRLRRRSRRCGARCRRSRRSCARRGFRLR